MFMGALRGRPRSVSQRFMKAISSVWEMVMRWPMDWTSGFAECVAMRRVISTAWP